MNDPLRPTRSEALTAWANRVRANRDQAEAYREGEPPKDFYAPMAASFRADPLRTDEPALDALRNLVLPGETWLDIGAGGGRYALALAQKAGKVVAVEPSAGMRSVLGDGMTQYGISNIELIPATWPLEPPPAVDVAFISHVGYDIEDIGPFLDAMERAASRLCVAVLLYEAPASVAAGAWPPVHGVERAVLPALPEFLTLLLARGKTPEIRLAGVRGPALYDDAEVARRFLRHQLFIQEGGAKDALLAAWLESHRTTEGIRIADHPLPIGVVTWSP
ncbi:MAG: class I SAM-dependent methyltransferase [Dehalococcoidia bacterium]|nr:class I SAM-dependent methyltransferase [Dehalococcoidia bacterium]MCB9486860.1 class I SAM-dependent methyltransferase [Thermoflexaceae bacterium]